MSRIFGFAVGAIWLFFAYTTLQRSLDGWSEGSPDIGFWWAVITVLLSLAAGVALIGTARHRRTGPSK